MNNEHIRTAGLKVTLPRLKILDLLENHTDEHLSAEQIYKLLLQSNEEIGLATIYRALTQFEEAGLVKRHYFEGAQSVFELDRGSHHDHILCLDCGHVEEFIDQTIEKQQHGIARERGYELCKHSLILYARCTKEHCPKREK